MHATPKQPVFSQIIRCLADGQVHTRQQLAQQANMALHALPQQIQYLTQQYDLCIQQTPGGYCLEHPLCLLDQKRILSVLYASTPGNVLPVCHLFWSTSSTNILALQSPPAPEQATVWLTEYQTAGRGRRGKRWIGGFARQLQFSLAYTFRLPMQQLSGLSIAVGSVLAKRLSDYAVPELSLKWPNDLLCRHKKVAGILVEAQSDIAGSVCVVIGVGINLLPDARVNTQVKQPHTCLQAQGIQPDRNQLAGELLNDLLRLCHMFPHTGLAPYLTLWQQYDHWLGQQVTLSGTHQTLQGRYLGLDEVGHLRLAVNGKVQICHAGELSLRQTTV